jgi:hypothetical protein
MQSANGRNEVRPGDREAKTSYNFVKLAERTGLELGKCARRSAQPVDFAASLYSAQTRSPIWVRFGSAPL